MNIRKIAIERFRGIENLEWIVGGDFVCLVGAGDSTKSTILDAIDLALSSRWNVPFDDADFYAARTDEAVRIVVTVGDVPDEFMSDAKFGLFARGWTTDSKLRDEPEDDDQLVLSIQLLVDSSLEPSWTVINDRSEEGKPISAKDRERLGCVRLGDYLDRHFAWGRGSVLSRLTGEADSLAGTLAEAGRAARTALDGAPSDKLEKLNGAAQTAKRVGGELGVSSSSDYRPRLDVQALSVGVGSLSLHDGAVPLRRAGLGSRRLLAIAMQRELAKGGGVTLVDEIEHGLEPHRIRHLLRQMRERRDETHAGPVLLTTHSPIALGELKASEMRVVRSRNGVTQVLAVDAALQPIVLKASEAFFARKVLVCEGMTELGLCRRLDVWWGRNGRSFGRAGVALAHGRGQEASAIAKALAELGYEVALFGDSDRPIEPSQSVLESSGVRVILWGDGIALEERVARDLPWDGVAAIVHLAMDTWGEQSIRDALASQLAIVPARLVGSPQDWRNLQIPETDVRNGIGAVAKEQGGSNRKGWFKRVDLAEELADVVIQHFDAIGGTNLRETLTRLRTWAHGDG